MDGIDLPQLLSAVASVGVAVWATYHMLSNMIPKMLERHEVERDRAMTRFETSLDKIIANHEATVARMTKHCEEEVQIVVNAFNSRQTA